MTGRFWAILLPVSAMVGLQVAAMPGLAQDICTLTYRSHGQEREMRLQFQSETTATLLFRTESGQWEADPAIAPVICDATNTCRSDPDEEGTQAGVTIDLARGRGLAAYAEWRRPDDAVLQWAYLTDLSCTPQ